MDETTKIVETPHGKISNRSSRSSFGSYDSGYLTLTPQSVCHSPIAAGRSRISSTSEKRHYRLRVEPWHSDRSTRYRSKFNQLLDNSYCDLSEVSEPSSSGNERCNDTRNQSMIPEYQEFGMELRTRNLRNWRATVPVTPASKMEILSSSPPSPAIPSSSFQASEPTEDVEMNLMKSNECRMQQSTPQTSSPRGFKSMRKSNPIIMSAENRRLSRLAISDLATVPEIKPKRLDFTQQGLTASLKRSRAMRDFTGAENVDMLLLLGEKSNHWRIVSKILSFLSPLDLCSVSMVSKAWRRICANDSKATVRRLAYIILRQDVKENLKIRKAKLESDITMSPRSRYTRKGYLLEVQNLLQLPQKNLPPNSPPVSPSKVKFHSFVKVILFSEKL